MAINRFVHSFLLRFLCLVLTAKLIDHMYLLKLGQVQVLSLLSNLIICGFIECSFHEAELLPFLPYRSKALWPLPLIQCPCTSSCEPTFCLPHSCNDPSKTNQITPISCLKPPRASHLTQSESQMPFLWIYNLQLVLLRLVAGTNPFAERPVSVTAGCLGGAVLTLDSTAPCITSWRQELTQSSLPLWSQLIHSVISECYKGKEGSIMTGNEIA